MPITAQIGGNQPIQLMMKQKIKKLISTKLHLVDQQPYDILDAVVSRGIKGYIEFDYETFKRDILDYLSEMKVSGYAYKYSGSREKPCIYASIYAVMTEGLLGVLEQRTPGDLRRWGDYINSFQNPKDGLYYDPALECPAFEHIGNWNEGWGKHHLMGHIIIVLARLGQKPKHPLTYLEKYYDKEYLTEWMNKFDFSIDAWTASNYFMNLYTVLEYARDYMGEKRASEAIEVMTQWLLQQQKPTTGMWHEKPIEELTRSEKLNIVRAAYHFYPLFEYEKIEIPYKEKIVGIILQLQNRWGGWTDEGGNSGACEDIDAIDPLLRYAHAVPGKSDEISNAIKRSLIWQFASRNSDKGFSFYVRGTQNYGGHELTTSLRDESSMFATWFRILCIAYEMQYLKIPNDFHIGIYPGYEIRIQK